VLVVLLGVLDELLMSEPALGVLAVEPPAVVSAAVPPAPMEVPLPVVPPRLEPVPVLAPAVVSVLVPEPVVPMEPEPLAVLLLVSLGEVVVEGVVLDVVEDELEASSRLPQAVRDRAAIKARAAHCAIGDLIIRELLEGLYRGERSDSVPAACGSL
jgi:hypothetical protein